MFRYGFAPSLQLDGLTDREEDTLARMMDGPAARLSLLHAIENQVPEKVTLLRDRLLSAGYSRTEANRIVVERQEQRQRDAAANK